MPGTELKLCHQGRNYRMRLINFGRISYSRHESLWHYHPFYHLILLSSGRHYLDLAEDRTVLLEKNTLFLINPLQKHRFRHLPGEEFEHTALIWQLIDGKNGIGCFPLQELMHVAFRDCQPFLACQLLEPEAYRLMEQHQILMESMRENADPGWWGVKFFHVWYSFLELLIQKSAVITPGEPNKMVGEIELLILKNFSDPAFSRKSAADYLDRSPNYLDTLFRSHTGLTISEALRRKRLDSAARMLVASDKTVGDVAGCCGFADLSNFSKIFLRKYGVSPLRYRSARHNRLGYFNIERQEIDSPASARGNSIDPGNRPPESAARAAKK